MTDRDDTLTIASISIDYGIREDGSPDVRVSWTSERGRDLVTLLGMLDLTRDTILRDHMTTDEETDR